MQLTSFKLSSPKLTHHNVIVLMLFVCAYVCFCSLNAFAQSESKPSPVSNVTEFADEVRVGFTDDASEGGLNYYKLGKLVPVTVTLQGGSKKQTGIVSMHCFDSEGIVTRTNSRAIQVLPKQKQEVTVYTSFGRNNSPIEAQFIVDGESVATKSFYDLPAMNSKQQLILSIGDYVAVERGIPENIPITRAPEIIQLNSAEQLPAQAEGYDSVDQILICTNNTELLSQISEAQYQAIKDWVRRGGRLIVSTGRKGEILAKSIPLSEILPGRFTGEIRELHRNYKNIETYASSSDTLFQASMQSSRSGKEEKQPSFPLLMLEDFDGATIDSKERADLPLILRQQVGFGIVTLVAFDLAHPRFESWGGSETFFARLFRWQDLKLDVAVDAKSAGVGVTDLSSQLFANLDDHSDLPKISFLAVGVFIFVYFLIIGPLDYLLVKKVFKKMEITWITFPCWILLMSLLAWYIAKQSKSTDILMNQISVVDLDLSQKSVRSHDYLGMFSPTTSRYELSSTAYQGFSKEGKQSGRPFSESSQLGWYGLSEENGVGRMYKSGADSFSSSNSYEMTPSQGKLSNVPFEVWSTRSFASRFYSDQANSLTSMIQADLTYEPTRETFAGTITSQLPFDLEASYIVYENRLYKISKSDVLASGSTNTIDSANPSYLQDRITRKRLVIDPSSNQNMFKPTPYRPLELDPYYHLETALFFELIGGTQYTTLTNAYQSNLDMSELLETNVAIIVGRSKQPPVVQFTADTDDDSLVTKENRWVYYRIIVPVALKTKD